MQFFQFSKNVTLPCPAEVCAFANKDSIYPRDQQIAHFANISNSPRHFECLTREGIWWWQDLFYLKVRKRPGLESPDWTWNQGTRAKNVFNSP